MILWLIKSRNIQSSALLCNIAMNDQVVLTGEAVYDQASLCNALPVAAKLLDIDCDVRGVHVDKESLITHEQLLRFIEQANQVVYL